MIALARESRASLTEESVAEQVFPGKTRREASRVATVAMATLGSVPVAEQPGKPSVIGVPFEGIYQ